MTLDGSVGSFVGLLRLVSPRVVRKQEVIAWRREDVEVIKKKLNTRAYLFLAIYTIVVVWINLCYVATYDTPTAW